MNPDMKVERSARHVWIRGLPIEKDIVQLTHRQASKLIGLLHNAVLDPEARRRGGIEGGKARAKKLSRKRRVEIAQMGAEARNRNRQSQE